MHVASYIISANFYRSTLYLSILHRTVSDKKIEPACFFFNFSTSIDSFATSDISAVVIIRLPIFLSKIVKNQKLSKIKNM